MKLSPERALLGMYVLFCLVVFRLLPNVEGQGSRTGEGNIWPAGTILSAKANFAINVARET
jgi:hypothetical protein